MSSSVQIGGTPFVYFIDKPVNDFSDYLVLALLISLERKEKEKATGTRPGDQVDRHTEVKPSSAIGIPALQGARDLREEFRRLRARHIYDTMNGTGLKALP